MKLTPVSKLYSMPGLWAIFGGVLGLAISFLVLSALRDGAGVVMSQLEVSLILVAGAFGPFIAAGMYCADRANRMVRELQMKVRGVYGFQLSDAEAAKLLPVKERFGFKGSEQVYGTIERQTASGPETRTLMRSGNVFSLDKVYKLELTGLEPVYA